MKLPNETRFNFQPSFIYNSNYSNNSSKDNSRNASLISNKKNPNNTQFYLNQTKSLNNSTYSRNTQNIDNNGSLLSKSIDKIDIKNNPKTGLSTSFNNNNKNKITTIVTKDNKENSKERVNVNKTTNKSKIETPTKLTKIKVEEIQHNKLKLNKEFNSYLKEDHHQHQNQKDLKNPNANYKKQILQYKLNALKSLKINNIQHPQNSKPDVELQNKITSKTQVKSNQSSPSPKMRNKPVDVSTESVVEKKRDLYHMDKNSFGAFLDNIGTRNSNQSDEDDQNLLNLYEFNQMKLSLDKAEKEQGEKFSFQNHYENILTDNEHQHDKHEQNHNHSDKGSY